MSHDDPHSQAAEARAEGQPVEAQYARQGRPGTRILVLLIVSSVAAAVLLLGMWFLSNGGFATTNANTGGQAVDANAFQGDAATPPSADAPTTSTGEPTAPPTGQSPNVNAPTTSVQPSQP